MAEKPTPAQLDYVKELMGELHYDFEFLRPVLSTLSRGRMARVIDRLRYEKEERQNENQCGGCGSGGADCGAVVQKDPRRLP